MNYKMVLKTVGRLLWAEAAFLCLPLFVSLYYKENLFLVYLIVIGLLLGVGALTNLINPQKRTIYAREGFVIVSLSWILLSFFGSLPFVFSQEISSLIDAFFETVSGFTTTGATILTNIESMPKSLLFWRAFTHWIGGMGILMFVLAFLPQKDMQSMHIMRAEVPGPSVGKLVSKTTVTARILYIIYTVFTVAQIIALLCCKMPLFDSVTTAFATAGTGGFSVKNASIAAYNSLPIEIVCTFFMLLFGINFNLFYLIIVKQFKRAFKSEELWTYIGIIVISISIITINILPLANSVGNALRQAGFQVVSIITTTGFITADYNNWPVLSQFILVFLMFIGACSGSTGGGLKVGRIIILFKSGIKELKRAINPRKVQSLRLDNAALDKGTTSATCIYFVIYMMVIAVSILLVSLNSLDFSTTFSSVVTCINNVGPGLSLVGPVENFNSLSDLTKLVLATDMLIGRLEVLPMIILFIPSTWKKST